MAERHGRVDIAFNNAGISPPDDDSILVTGLDAWERVLRVNTTSVYLCCKYAIPHMQRQGKGSIINTASFVALLGAATSQIAYTASKGGVLAMTRELGVQFAREGIRINALCPGPVATPLLLELFAEGSGAGRPPAGARADGPVRRAGRDRRRGGVPGQRRRVVHDGGTVRGRRRHHRGVRDSTLIGLDPSNGGDPTPYALLKGEGAESLPARVDPCGGGTDGSGRGVTSPDGDAAHPLLGPGRADGHRST